MDSTAALVLATTDRLFTAMRERDGDALRALIHPRAQVFSIRPEGLSVRTAEEFIGACVDAAEPVDERIREAEVRVDGDLAVLWASYEVRFGQRFSHEGFDSFQFIREGDAWRLVSAAYTVRPPSPRR